MREGESRYWLVIIPVLLSVGKASGESPTPAYEVQERVALLGAMLRAIILELEKLLLDSTMRPVVSGVAAETKKVLRMRICLFYFHSKRHSFGISFLFYEE